MQNTFLILALALLFFLGCSKDNTTPSSSYTPSCGSTVKSYSADVAPLVQTYCAGCHSNLASYSGIKAASSQVRAKVASGAMPEGITLSSTQKDIIVCWIDSGAENN